MTRPYYTGNFIGVLLKHQNDDATLKAALDEERNKVAESLRDVERDELISMINALHMALQLELTSSELKSNMVKNLEKGLVKQAIFIEKTVDPTLDRMAELDTKLKNHDSNLSKGRTKGNEARQSKSKKLNSELVLAIRDYFKDHSNASNDELVHFLETRGFVGPGKFTLGTLTRKVSGIAPKYRNELPGQ